MKIARTLAALAVLVFASTAFALGSGERAPELGLQDLNGHPVTLASLRGKVVLVDFWATWCAPCRDELPHLEEFYKKYSDKGFVVVGVSVDRESENIGAFLHRMPLTFPIIHDSGHEIVSRYHPNLMPTSFIIDRAGVIRHTHAGYSAADLSTLEHEIKTLVDQH